MKVTSIDQIPTEWQESIKESLQSRGQTTNYQNWLSEKKDSSDLQINDMPSGLPYDVDMSKYQTDTSDSSSTSDGSSSDGATTDSANTADNESTASAEGDASTTETSSAN